jgi:hypothetical protein
MNTPTEDSWTNANRIKVNWEGITAEEDTGGDPIDYYKLEWDQGSGSWVELTSNP